MNFLRKNTLCLFCLLGCSTLVAQDSSWNGYATQNKTHESVTPSRTGTEEVRFYLLRTGFVTEGTATNDGKQYILKTNFGTMHVPIANVEFVGQTREDIYQYKKKFIDDRNCNELMKFAEWCFNNKLPQQGIAEYQRALAVAPNSILADVIRKRLEAVQNLVQNSAQNSDAELGRLSNVQVEQRADDEADAGLGNWSNGIPKPILETFSKKVQPLLVSRCAAADCHGSNSDNEFKLKIPNHTFGNATYRNLRSVIQSIDLDYPAESQLLSALVTYHGGTKPAFSVESPQYHNVVQWVQNTAKELPKEFRTPQIGRTNVPRSKNKEESANVLPSALRNAMIDAHPTEKTGKDSQQGRQQNIQQEIPATFLVPVTSPATNSTIPANYAPTRLNVLNPPMAEPPMVEPEAENSGDPFDPNIFNNRYHGNVKRQRQQ